MWEQVDVVLKDAKGILDELQAYKGAGAEIREVQDIPVRWCRRGEPSCRRQGGREGLHSSAESSCCHVVCPSIQAVRRNLKKTLMQLMCF